MPGIGILSLLVVDPGLDIELMGIANLVACHDPRANGPMRVE